MNSINNSIKKYFFQLFQTILEIIEDKPNFLISKKIYCILMTINIFQISGYVFCTSGKRLFYDQKIKIVAHVNEVSTGTFLLLLKGNDNLTIFFFLVICFVVYFYTSYIVFLNYVKNEQRSWYLQNKKSFMKINQMLIIFFTIYYWIFLTPFTEIGLGMLSCNENAFLQEYRQKGNCSDKPQIWNVLGGVAVVLSVTTNILISFFFRNYEFCESNLLKRRFAYLQIPIIFSFFFLQMLYYLGEVLPTYFRYIMVQVMGISMILDIFLNFPYRDQVISIFYIIGTSFFWVSHTILTIFYNVASFQSTELFYLMSFSIVLVAFVIYSITKYQYYSVINIAGSSTQFSSSNILNNFDFYLEQFWLAGQQAQKDDKNKFNLLHIVSQHKEHCMREICNCKQEDLYDEKRQLNVQLVLNIIDTLFSDCLKSKAAIKNRATREHLFMKYITFIAKFQRNPLRSYYELKKYFKIHPNDNSSYFIGVSQVLGRMFKQMIIAQQELLYSVKILEQKSTFNQKVTLSINDILKTQEIKNTLIPLLAQYTNHKLNFYKKLKLSVTSFDSLRNISKDLYKQSLKLIYQFNQYQQYFSEISKIEPNFILQKVIFILNQSSSKKEIHLIKIIINSNNMNEKIINFINKILQIFQIVIFNEVKKPLQLETEMIQLIQKGSARPSDELNSFNLVGGNIITIFISVNQNYKILNQPNSQLTNFFGYNQIEFSSIKKIEDLMPNYISKIHSQLISGFIHKGHSQILSSCNQVFSQNKNGFIFPVNLQISINYSFQDDFRMSATLLKRITQQGYIIFNQVGKIEGVDQIFFSNYFDLKIQDEKDEEKPTSSFEWNKTNCLKNETYSANLIVDVINSSNSNYQHIVENQEFIFVLEINDLKQVKQKVINTEDLNEKLQNKNFQQTAKEIDNIYQESYQFETSLDNSDSLDAKSIFSNQNAKQCNNDFHQQNNTQNKIQKTNIFYQSSSQLAKQNNSQQKLNSENQKPTSLNLIQYNQDPKLEYNLNLNRSQIDESMNNIQSKENIIQEDTIIMNLMSQIGSSRNLLVQNQQELIFLSPRVLKHHQDQNNNKFKQENEKIFSPDDKQINQLNCQTAQLISHQNNLNSPYSVQIPIQNYQQLEKSPRSKIQSKKDSFQLLNLFRQKQKQNYFVKNQNNTVAAKLNNSIQNKFNSYQENQKMLTSLEKNTLSQPTNNTDKQGKDDINFEQQILIENIHDGSSTTSSSSSRQNMNLNKIIHKKSIRSNSKIITLITAQKMKSVCEQSSQQQNNQNQINSIYFMYDNLIEISSNLKEFIDRNIELHKSNIDQLQKNVFWILLITCIVFIITSILSIPLIKQINKYQEIIYFTFSRTTLEETEKEIAKLELFNKNLINQDNSWMEYNFCSDFILDKTTQEFNSKESSTAHSISNVLRQKKLKKDNNSNQQQNINSKMNDSKLSIFKYFIQLTFFGFTFVCFFTASIIFFYRQHSYLKQQLDVFNTTMKARLSFQSILTTSEIAFRKDMILSVDQNFPFDKNEQSVNIFQKDIEILSSYTTYMSNAIQDTSIFDNQSINYLQSLFNQSLCDKFQNEEVCQSTNNSTTKENVINGFFSVISSYLNYFQQFNQLLQSGLSQGQITKLSWEYSSQDQYKYLIAYGFQLPAETFGLIQNQLYSLIRDLIKLIQQFYTFYMIIGEIILIFIWIIFSFYFKQKIKLDVKSTQFALTCLPFQKAQEDTTIHLLRSILKY